MQTPKVSGIYRLLNKVNGKSYVGQAADMYRRRNQHWSSLTRGEHFNRKLTNAFRKHGRAAFVFEVCCVCEHSELTRCEQWYVDSLDSVNNGYNIRTCVDSNRGVKMSPYTKSAMKAYQNRPEVKAAKSAFQKQHSNNPAVRAARSAFHKRHMNKQHVKEAKSAFQKTYQNQPEVKAANSSQSKAYHNRPEVKAAQSKRATELNNRPGAKEANSAWHKEYQNRPEVKAAISKRSKESMGRPAVKIATALRMKEFANRPEVKAAWAASMQALRDDPVRKSAMRAKKAATTIRNKMTKASGMLVLLP